MVPPQPGAEEGAGASVAVVISLEFSSARSQRSFVAKRPLLLDLRATHT
jgi:hypothetical protein